MLFVTSTDHREPSGQNTLTTTNPIFSSEVAENAVSDQEVHTLP